MITEMPTTSASHPPDDAAIFTALRNVLATLYPVEDDSRVVVADAGLNAKQIAFSARAQTNWHHILLEAHKQNRLMRLLEIACNEYPNNQALVTAWSNYRCLLDLTKQSSISDIDKKIEDGPHSSQSGLVHNDTNQRGTTIQMVAGKNATQFAQVYGDVKVNR